MPSTTIPKKVWSRKDEITEQFLALVDRHLQDIRNNSVEKTYHTADLARLLFVHPVHLTNTIKLTTGKSPCDHLEEGLIAEAYRLLATTALSVADVGYRLTYSTPSNFVKFFKNMTGITPLQYRKSLQEAQKN